MEVKSIELETCVPVFQFFKKSAGFSDVVLTKKQLRETRAKPTTNDVMARARNTSMGLCNE